MAAGRARFFLLISCKMPCARGLEAGERGGELQHALSLPRGGEGVK